MGNVVTKKGVLRHETLIVFYLFQVNLLGNIKLDVMAVGKKTKVWLPNCFY